MAHYAEIGLQNEVLRVIVIGNNELLDSSGTESSKLGAAFCRKLLGGVWFQTSYNAVFRKNFAARGSTFDVGRDAFISPKPHNSWILDEETCNWVAPTTYPSDDGYYTWDEGTQSWVLDEDANA